MRRREFDLTDADVRGTRGARDAHGCTGMGSYAVSSAALLPEIQPKKLLLTAALIREEKYTKFC